GVGANATIDCPAAPSFSSPTASDNCSATLTYADATTSGSCAGNYSVTRTWTATDPSGHTATASQTITVQDVTPPSIGAAGADATIDCPDSPSFTAPTASDECSAATVNVVSDVTTPGCSAGTYTRTITW